MSRERLKQLSQQITDHARSIADPTERQRYVYTQCTQHPELVESLADLLLQQASQPASSSTAADSEFESAIVTVLSDSSTSKSGHGRPPRGSDSSASSDATLVGKDESTDFDIEAHPTIDGYKLMEQLGEGGMGAVYVAQQTEPVRRKVAIKIIRTGMSSKDVRARFAAERQALAMMDHPNIARVFGGGTTHAGQPYLVMELVQGLPITQYADENALSLRQRLQLMIDVCMAVQHAHHKGVIHRDIKPSNILVAEIDGKAIPKVIDFGLAKALHEDLTDETLYTQFTQMIGTPLYMSPEQAAMGVVDVDTRSDVYSLGVLLYELLTGRTPFDRRTLKQAAFDEMRRIIREQVPRRPSTAMSTIESDKLASLARCRRLDERRLRDSLRGELDWIVMKALEKDRGRRYESAGEFARDIQRHLDDEPVRACPPSAAYQLRKMWTRHKVVLMTASFVAACAAFALAVSLWKAAEAEDARQLANRRYVAERDARRVANDQRDLANREKRRTREMLYVADMKLASDALAAADVPRLAALLERHRPQQGEEDLRDFAWYYLHRAIDIPQHWEADLGSRIWTIAVSPDGKLCAAGTDDGTLRIYDVLDGTLIQHCKNTATYSLAWSPNARQLAAALGDGSIQLYEVSADVLGATDEDAPEGESAALQRGRVIVAHEEMVLCVQFSADGKELFSSSSDAQIRSWSTATGERLRVLPIHDRTVDQFDVTPDGRFLASASSDQSVAIVDLSSGKVSKRFRSPTGKRFVSLDISPNGRYVAAGDIDGNLLVVDLESLTSDWKRQRDGIESIVFLADNTTVAAGDRGGSIHVWNIAHRKDKSIRIASRNHALWQAHRGRVEALAVANGSSKILSGSRNGILLCWMPDHKNQLTFPAEDLAIAYDGTLLATHEGVRRYDSTGEQELGSLGDPSIAWRWVAAASQTPRLVAAAEQGPVVVFDLEAGEEIDRWQVDSPVHQLRISPDGTQVFARLYDTDEIRQFETGKAASTRTWTLPQCSYLALSYDANLMATGSLDDVLLFPLDGSASQGRLVGHDSTVSAIHFHPEDATVATVGNDRRLKLWDLDTQQEIISTNASDHPVITCLDFSSDGQLLVTSGVDGIIHFWHTETFQPLMDIDAERRVVEVRFGMNDRRLFAVLDGSPREVRVYVADEASGMDRRSQAVAASQ